MDEENGTYTLSAYLIAQLGKNYKDGVNKKITGEQLLQAAIDTIKELQYMAANYGYFYSETAVSEIISLIKDSLQGRAKQLQYGFKIAVLDF